MREVLSPRTLITPDPTPTPALTLTFTLTHPHLTSPHPSEKKEVLDTAGEVMFRISTMCFTLGGFMCPAGVYGLMMGGLYFANGPEDHSLSPCPPGPPAL